MTNRLPAVIAVATTLLAGCASSPTPSQPSAISPAPTSASPAPAEHGSLASCLHSHGVPDSAGSAVLGPPPGVDQATWDQAMKDCSTLAPGPAAP
jgi:hypothetical protein